MMPQTSNAPTESSPAAKPDSVWAVIDARRAGGEVSPTTRLAGLTLIARLARMVGRQGWHGAIVWTDDDDRRRELEAALAAEPPPAGLELDYAVGGADPTADDDRHYVPLDGCAIYSADALATAAETGGAPEPLARPTSRADLKLARNRLERMITKSIDQDGVVSYFAFRPLSRRMTRLLIDTPITPNHISLLAMAFGIAAAICACFGSYQMVAIAGALYWIGAVVDCVDGELARLRLRGSRLGEWLDTLADDVSTYGLMAGLGVGLWRTGADPWWLYVAAGGAVLGFVLQAKLYADLSRWGMTIDTAQYPWFFGTPSEGDSAERGAFGRFSYLLGFVFRRDAFVTIVATVLLLGLARGAVIGMSIGLGFFFLVFVTDGVVTTVRGGRPDGRSRMGWSLGFFGIKDLFTIVNLMGGVTGIYFAFHGNLEYAGYAIFAGYLLGDALDGPVARMTNTSNRFGGEFDAAADHIAQAIAPAVMLFAAFEAGGYRWLGLGLMALFIVTASIRQARFNVADFNYPLTYCGLPRTISGLVAISLPNSTLFFDNNPYGYPYEMAAGVMILVALLNLVPVPYMTHKGKRKMQPYVKFFVLTFLLLPPVSFFVARDFFYDIIFFITFGYALTAWIPILPEERREFWAEYRRWSHEVATKK
jgi:phosphatidylserine synthase